RRPAGRARRVREHVDQRDRDQRARRTAGAHRHRASLTRWPACSVSASSFGFRRWIVSSDTPVLTAIAESVSPDLTVYMRRLRPFLPALVFFAGLDCCVLVPPCEGVSSLSSVLST